MVIVVRRNLRNIGDEVQTREFYQDVSARPIRGRESVVFSFANNSEKRTGIVYG